ncbi:PREDICTED: uncharacterized protein LOC101304211 [Fragaria vesca subsp. vesca]|uniref:uncharacterized protein LOC101304211 n=1 Tax=Fragaria vesca subsp. vesca TaxID=101020 RepID=UPI0002C324E5|nr:PREDICTED: uncharacterized protein LOC101304211 [Fragaria vesca subsp. vesca]
MASGAENNQPRNQEQPSGLSDQPSAVSNYPPSGGNNYPPSAMNYPQQPYPPQGYAGYGYNPYPPAAYAQDPAVAYYGTQQYANEGGNACFRCICLIMLLSLMLTIIASIIFFFVAKPDHTNFKVDNFSVSNFNVNTANKVVTGQWDAKVAVESGRARLRIDKVESNLYQKDTWLAPGSDWTSTTGYWDDFSWSNANTLMEFKFDLNNATAPAEDMQKEIKDWGGVTFNLRLSLNYVERSSGFWWHMKNGVMKITCKDLKIGLAVGTNTGTLSGDKKDCEVSS